MKQNERKLGIGVFKKYILKIYTCLKMRMLLDKLFHSVVSHLPLE